MTGDRKMLRRALGNLLSNAIRHTSHGDTVRVALSTATDESIGIVVENPGSEIPPEHIPRLFDRFFRVGTSRQQDGEGAGLGLAIVKSIIEAHCGEIQVTSTQGRTRFHVSLPGSQPQVV